jgi:hypothetical protein
VSGEIMFSNDLKSFIILNIYFLLIIDFILVVSVYYVIIKGKRLEKKYKNQKAVLTPIVTRYIQNGGQTSEVKSAIKGDYRKEVAIDIMLDYSDQHSIDIGQIFAVLDLDQAMMDKLDRKLDIKHLRKLAFMRSEKAYPFLIKTAAMSDDFDLVYMCFIGLSMIALPKDKKENAIHRLVASDIAKDRKIEVLRQFDFSFEEWFAILENEDTQEGKVIFLRNILEKEGIKDPAYSDRLLSYLDDDTEVRVAAILALCSSGNDKYAGVMASLYEKEESWEVRVSIAKGVSSFSYRLVKDLLQKMMKDEEWWVRYNAIKTIVSMGSEGLFTLIELSLDEDKNIADLAYYFLNANKEVYNTVKNVEV